MQNNVNLRLLQYYLKPELHLVKASMIAGPHASDVGYFDVRLPDFFRNLI